MGLALQLNFKLQSMKKQLPNDQITRMIQRQNVITFKRKLDGKASVKSQKQQDDDISSAKSHPTDDPSFSKPSKKSIPLPELNKEKYSPSQNRKRLILRNILPETKSQSNSNYLQKQVRQQDNLMLKNQNNSLTSENIKLKTKNMNLQKEINRLLKIVEEDPQKHKIISSKEIKMRPIESTSLKIAIRNMQKELDDVKKENGKIKTSIKFTTIAELEVERDNILEETVRLREMLEEQRNKLMFLKANQHGISTMEQRLMQLQERNHFLSRENNELKGKVSKTDIKDRSHSKISDNEKNLNKMVFNVRRLLKEKQREIQVLKCELKKQESKGNSSKPVEGSQNENSRSREVKSQLNNNKSERPDKLKVVKEKRLMSKSAQKYRTAVTQEKMQDCENCKKLKDDNFVLKKDIEKLKADLQQAKIDKSPLGELSKTPIAVPSQQEIDKLSRFLVHRFKAHHLTLDEAAYHLISFQGKPEDLDQEISVSQLLQISMAEPFSIISDRYIQSFIVYICYNEMISSPPDDLKCIIEDKKKLKRQTVQDYFKSLVGNYQLINQTREEEMFIQIAELVTQYQQHILKALTEKRNSQSTIAEKDFYQFFKEIELEKEYIDFMVCQIILESLDLDHLNIYNLFQIFYMPPQEQVTTAIDPMNYGARQPLKKKYQMIDSVVKEEDEEYEQSKSFMQSRQKTLSKHDDQKDPEQIQEAEEQQLNDKKGVVENIPHEQYEQDHFQEENMSAPEEEEKVHEEAEKVIVPQHFQIQQLEEEYADDYEN